MGMGMLKAIPAHLYYTVKERCSCGMLAAEMYVHSDCRKRTARLCVDGERFKADWCTPHYH